MATGLEVMVHLTQVGVEGWKVFKDSLLASSAIMNTCGLFFIALINFFISDEMAEYKQGSRRYESKPIYSSQGRYINNVQDILMSTLI